MQAMSQAAGQLAPAADYLLVDGNRLPAGLAVPARAVVKGDATCYAIAAASIIAKVIIAACASMCSAGLVLCLRMTA